MGVPTGTMVATPTGWKAVDDLVPGDRVVTRTGEQPVLWAGRSGREQVVKVAVTRRGVFRATHDHDVWADGRWLQMALVVPGMRCIHLEQDWPRLNWWRRLFGAVPTGTPVAEVLVDQIRRDGMFDVIDITVHKDAEYFADGFLVRG